MFSGFLHGSAYSSSCCSGLCCCYESSFCKDYFFNYHLEISLILPFFFVFLHVQICMHSSHMLLSCFGLFSPGVYWWCLFSRNVLFPSGHLKFAVHETFQNYLDFLLSDYMFFFFFLLLLDFPFKPWSQLFHYKDSGSPFKECVPL